MPPIDVGSLPSQSFDWGVITWLVAPSVTPGAGMSFGEVQLLPGQGHGRHDHPGSEEILYVLSGEGEQTVGDDDAPFPVRAGDTIYVPTGVFHSTLNTGWGVMRLLAIYNPAGPERDLESLPDHHELPAGSVQGWDRRYIRRAEVPRRRVVGTSWTTAAATSRRRGECVGRIGPPWGDGCGSVEGRGATQRG